jgi:hypothetical protein
MEIPGLGKVSVDPQKRVIRAIKVLSIDKNTVDELAAMGLSTSLERDWRDPERPSTAFLAPFVGKQFPLHSEPNCG